MITLDHHSKIALENLRLSGLSEVELWAMFLKLKKESTTALEHYKQLSSAHKKALAEGSTELVKALEKKMAHTNDLYGRADFDGMIVADLLQTYYPSYEEFWQKCMEVMKAVEQVEEAALKQVEEAAVRRRSSSSKRRRSSRSKRRRSSRSKAARQARRGSPAGP